MATVQVLVHSAQHGEVPGLCHFAERALALTDGAWRAVNVRVCHDIELPANGAWSAQSRSAYVRQALETVNRADNNSAEWILALDARAVPAVSEQGLAALLHAAAPLVRGRACDVMHLGHLIRGGCREVTPGADFLELSAGSRSLVQHAFLMSAAYVRALGAQGGWLEGAEFVMATRRPCFHPPDTYATGWLLRPLRATFGWPALTSLATHWSCAKL